MVNVRLAVFMVYGLIVLPTYLIIAILILAYGLVLNMCIRIAILFWFIPTSTFGYHQIITVQEHFHEKFFLHIVILLLVIIPQIMMLECSHNL